MSLDTHSFQKHTHDDFLLKRLGKFYTRKLSVQHKRGGAEIYRCARIYMYIYTHTQTHTSQNRVCVDLRVMRSLRTLAQPHLYKCEPPVPYILYTPVKLYVSSMVYIEVLGAHKHQSAPALRTAQRECAQICASG